MISARTPVRRHHGHPSYAGRRMTVDEHTSPPTGTVVAPALPSPMRMRHRPLAVSRRPAQRSATGRGPCAVAGVR